MEAARLPVVIHSGSAPDGGRFTAPGPIRALLKRHPALPVVIAHMGAGEFGEYLEMAESWENVFLDTTMVFVDPMALGEFPLPLLSRLEGISHRILFGSDFPNIPYPLSHAVESVLALPLSGAAKRRILWENGRALFGLQGAGVAAKATGPGTAG